MRHIPVLAFALATLFAAPRAWPQAAPASQHPAMVGYLPQWGIYNDPPWILKDLLTSGGAGLLTQINYAQGTVRNGLCVVADPEADTNRAYTAAMSLDGAADPPQPARLVRAVDPDPSSAPLTAPPIRGAFHQLALLRARSPRLRTVLSIEGRGSEFARAALPENRTTFVHSCVDKFIRGHLGSGVNGQPLELGRLFDGIDLDWEFPQAGEGENYTALVEEFRRQLDEVAAEQHRAPMLLSVAAAPGLGRYPGVDWLRVAGAADQLGLMNYDYSGPWQPYTGLLAPLFPVPGDPRSMSVDATVREYEAAGVPAGKLLLGVPFYGYGWTAVPAGAAHGMFQPATSVRGDRPFRELSTLPGTMYRAPGSSTAWLYDGSTLWTFDDPVSAEAKASYAATHGLGGVMVWELSGDTPQGTLLHALEHGLLHPSPALAAQTARTPVGASAPAPGAVPVSAAPPPPTPAAPLR